MKNHLNTKPDTFSIMLEVVFYEEGDYMVAFCPALDLSSFGRNIKDAKESFIRVLNLFLEETHSRGTLEKILLDLGWSLQKKPAVKYIPPKSDIRSLKYPQAIRTKIEKNVLIPV